jgi:hypothetical protein
VIRGAVRSEQGVGGALVSSRPAVGAMIGLVNETSSAGSADRGWRVWLVVGGLAMALALPFVASATKAVSAEVGLRRAMAKRAPADRSVTLSIVDSTGHEQYGRLDPGVEAVLRKLGGGIPIRQVIFRETTDTNGGGFVLAAADGLAGLVGVTEGRLPASCRPERCEVVQLGDSASTTFDAGLVQSSFGLVVVGKAQRSNDLLLSGTFQTAGNTPLLVGDRTDDVIALAALSTHGRTLGWVQPVDAARVIDLGLTEWLGRAQSAPDDLEAVSPYFVGTVPSDAVAAETHRAEATAGAPGSVRNGLPVALVALTLIVGAGLQHRVPRTRRMRRMLRLTDIGAAVLLAAAAELVICGLMAARSQVGFGRVEHTALDGAPAAAVVLAVACLTAFAVMLIEATPLASSAITPNTESPPGTSTPE